MSTAIKVNHIQLWSIIDFTIKILSFYFSLKAQCAVRTLIFLTMPSINKLNKLFKIYDTFYIIILRISKFSTFVHNRINSILNVILNFSFQVHKSCSLILYKH